MAAEARWSSDGERDKIVLTRIMTVLASRTRLAARRPQTASPTVAHRNA